MSFAIKWSQIMMLPLPNGVVFTAMPIQRSLYLESRVNANHEMERDNDLNRYDERKCSSVATVSIIIILFDQAGVICFCFPWGVREKRYT